MQVNPNYLSNLSTALNNTQASVQQLTTELSSGVRVNSLSDDPVAAAENTLLLNQIQQDDSFTESANLVTGKLQVADATLGSVVADLTSVITLATSANNGTMNSSNLKSISAQIAGILGDVITLANTPYQGNYIFAGGQTSTTPFTQSNSTSPGVTTYNGDDDVNYLTLPNGQQIQMNVPGDQIFLGSGSNSVFAALNSLVADYASGTVNTAQAVSDTAALNTALNYVSQQRVVIDNSITSLTSAAESVSTEQTQLIAAQTNLLQADIPTISSRLSLAESQQTALEDVFSELGSASNLLFNKLQ